MTQPTQRRIQRYGWVPDLPDQRDHLFAAAPPVLKKLPPAMDLRDTKYLPAVYDQGQLGSCTANGIAAAIEFARNKRSANNFTPSRLFIYYNERSMEGTVDSDSGAMIRDGIKSVHKQGACAEDTWPYDIGKFATPPDGLCYQEAGQHKVSSYQRILRSLNQLKACIASGLPFVFGFTVYESFESDNMARYGHLNMPDPGESVLGGHAVLAVGYSDQQQRFMVRNSWGAGWGIDGYFTMPYAYLLNRGLSNDFWAIQVSA